MNLSLKLIVALLSFGLNPWPITAQNADISLLRNINVNRNQNLDPGFQFLSNSVTPLLVLVPSGMVLHQLIYKDSAQKIKTLVVCSSIALAGTITTSLKYLVQRKRPFVSYPDIELNTEAGSLSFPSGHTSASFSLATSLSLAYPKWYVIVPSYLWASGVGYSRMHLGAHYPSDVLVGAIIGSGSAYLSYRINKWYFRKK